MSTRRLFLADLTKLAALAAVVPNDWRVTRRPRYVDHPFSLGVASGDPTATSVMLWTRLAPRPFDPDGGMNGERVAVDWEVAEDDAFSRVVQRGRATAAPELGFSVHVDVRGLQPDRWYVYRFKAGDAFSPVGRARTSPESSALTPLRFAVASCQHWEQGLFTAYDHMAREELDLVTHLGDYIYEYAGIGGRVRMHQGLEIRTLDDYRRRYGQYKSDPSLQAAHARCPWVVTWDDHEVDNNYAGSIGENGFESEEQMLTRRAAAYQAWWEHQPVRVSRARSWADLSITRTVDWGRLARFWVLDTRQYRSDQPCGDGTRVVPCEGHGDPAQTLLGAPQERWLENGLRTSSANWQVLAQQVMVAPFDSRAGEPVELSMDQWSGYPAARERLLKMLGQHARHRSVVLTGDIHSSWVNELRSTYLRPDAPAIGAEFVGTSIASGGDGADQYRPYTAAAGDNPHIRWQNSRRGYLTCTVDAERWRTDYRILPFISKPDAPVQTGSRWEVVRGRAGVNAV